jgi:hypothetical protein
MLNKKKTKINVFIEEKLMALVLNLKPAPKKSLHCSALQCGMLQSSYHLATKLMDIPTELQP